MSHPPKHILWGDGDQHLLQAAFYQVVLDKSILRIKPSVYLLIHLHSNKPLEKKPLHSKLYLGGEISLGHIEGRFFHSLLKLVTSWILKRNQTFL